MSFNYVKSLLEEPGQTHYIVDSDYRTVAQGWARADGTGPIDLWAARNPGYVYRTTDYTSDAVALQAAVDSMVDFRADTLFSPPGNLSVAAAVNFDVPDMRLLGPTKSYPSANSAIFTAAVASAFTFTGAADRIEVGHLQFVPLTAAVCIDLAALSGADFHDNFYNLDGIAANVATIMIQAAASFEFLTVRNSYVWCDAAQGPWINCAGAFKGLTVSDFEIYLEAGTWAAAIDFEGVGTISWRVGPGWIYGTGGAALTSLVTQADKTQATSHGGCVGIRASTVGPAAGSLSVAAVTAAEADIVDCWRSVATDTVPPAHNAVTTDTQSGTPYTG